MSDRDNRILRDHSVAGTPDAFQAHYWNGALTRREAQTVFDQQGRLLIQLVKDVHGDSGVESGKPQDGLITLIAKLDLTLAFVLEKLGITPAEFQEFMASKTKEFLALQNDAKVAAETPAQSPIVSL